MMTEVSKGELHVCEKHGEYYLRAMESIDKVAEPDAYREAMWRSISKLRRVSACPKCREEERQEAHRKQEEAVRNQFENEIARGKNSIFPGLSKRFQSCSFANYVSKTDQQSKALMTVKNYYSNISEHLETGAGLVLSGKPGTGKSHLALAGIVQEIERWEQKNREKFADTKQVNLTNFHIDGAYVTCMDMVRSIRDTWRKDSEKSEKEVIAFYCRCDFLIIDEVGVQNGTDSEKVLMFEVMDRRYRDMKPTIILTNQGLEGFKEFVGDRVFDRLRDTSKWVSFDWESYRGKKTLGDA